MPRETVKLIDSIPPFKIFAEVIRAFSRVGDSTSIRELEDAINQEPTISARLIGVSNSALYSRGREICSVSDALMLIGFRRTQAILLTFILSERFPTGKCEAFNPKLYWYDAMMVGHCAPHIARHIKHDCDIYTLFTLGILHSIGILTLTYQFPSLMSEILKIEDKKHSEIEIFGIDHYEVGAQLLKHWGLPDLITLNIRNIRNEEYQNEYLHIIRLTKSFVDHFFHNQPLADGIETLLEEQTLVQNLRHEDEVITDMLQLMV